MEPSEVPKATQTTNTPPSKHLVVIVGALLVIVLGSLVWLFINRYEPKEVTSTNKKQVTINITSAGFEPKLVDVETGTTITWINRDSKVHHIESNPYPEANEHLDLNSRVALNSGETYVYKVGKPGEYNYHDRLYPEVNGRIVAKDK